MDTQNTSAPPRARSAVSGDRPRSRAHPPPPAGNSAVRSSGVVHDNTRHTTRFTVIGNHLAQHSELSLLAIGLGAHIQSLPTGAHVDIKTLADRFPEGATRIAAALRELEAHGYLRRTRERTPAGRIVTRTISCNQPTAARRHAATPVHRPRPQTPSPSPAHVPPDPDEKCAAGEQESAPRSERPAPREKRFTGYSATATRQ